MKFASWTSRAVAAAPMFRTTVPGIVYVPPPVTVELAAELKMREDPALAVRVPALVRLPAMANVLTPLITKVPVGAIVRLAETSPAAVAVTLINAGIVTLSVARGTVPVDQIAGFSQLPDAIAVMFAALAKPTTRRMNKKDRALLHPFLISMQVLAWFKYKIFDDLKPSD